MTREERQRLSAWKSTLRSKRGRGVLKAKYVKKVDTVDPDFSWDRRIMLSPEQWVSIAKNLEKEHSGIPVAIWLQKHRLGGLYQMMRTYPELFEGIKRQESLQKSRREWVLLAKKLEKEHNGIPGESWLRTHKLSGLYKAMRLHPDLFEGIKRQESLTRTPEQWVLISKKLAKKYNGVPRAQWLINHKLNGLYRVMSLYPKLFKDIKRRVGANPAPLKKAA